MKKKTIAFNVIIVFLSLLFIFFAVFFFRSSYLRFWEALKDLWNALTIYVGVIFGGEAPDSATVDNFSNVLTVNVLPDDFSGFKAKFLTWFFLLFNGKNFNYWGDSLYNGLSAFAIILAISIPIILLLYIVFRKFYGRENNDYNRDTLPLRIFKKLSTKIYLPVKRFITDFIHYVGSIKWLKKCWLILWIFNFNFASIIVAALAYYLYFSVSFNLLGLYRQIGKLFVDLSVVFNAVPLVVWIVIAWLIFCWWRRRIAVRRLRHFEARNCGFINELPIVSIACGSMGKKKTTLITDMALSQEVMFRQKAFDILQKNDIKFPFFAWILFEKQLQKCIEFGTVYNLATVKEFVKKKRERFKKNKDIYGYDYDKYGLVYNNGLYFEHLFDVLETYGQAYFIYILYSSLIVSNYSISTDNEMIDYDNFPMWAMDFFPKRFREKNSTPIYLILMC